jgi:hypothetical protein
MAAEPWRSSIRSPARPVLRNRAALGYGAHCFELYGMRTWIVAFWTFVVAQNGGSAVLAPVAVSVLVTLLAMPASILGNEAALRFGRHRAITTVMVASAALVLTIGLCAGLSPYLLLPLVLLHAVSVNGDSGALTSGMTQSAVPAYRGATMALHSTVGFGLSAAGAWAAGIALDAGGGAGQRLRMDGGLRPARRRHPARARGTVVVASCRANRQGIQVNLRRRWALAPRDPPPSPDAMLRGYVGLCHRKPTRPARARRRGSRARARPAGAG